MEITEFNLEAKKDSFEIICKPGYISISGSSILSDPRKFFKPLNEWIEDYVRSYTGESTEIRLHFEYVDTASVQAVFDLLRLFRKLPNDGESVTVNFYFEFDDPEMLEMGEIMAGRLKLNFNFIEISE